MDSAVASPPADFPATAPSTTWLNDPSRQRKYLAASNHHRYCGMTTSDPTDFRCRPGRMVGVWCGTLRAQTHWRRATSTWLFRAQDWWHAKLKTTNVWNILVCRQLIVSFLWPSRHWGRSVMKRQTSCTSWVDVLLPWLANNWATEFLLQRLSVAIQRGNAVAVMRYCGLSGG